MASADDVLAAAKERQEEERKKFLAQLNAEEEKNENEDYDDEEEEEADSSDTDERLIDAAILIERLQSWIKLIDSPMFRASIAQSEYMELLSIEVEAEKWLSGWDLEQLSTDEG